MRPASNGRTAAGGANWLPLDDAVTAEPLYQTDYVRACDLKKLRFIHAIVAQEEPKSILELGCGPGSIMMTLAGFDRVVGVEISPERRALARSRGLHVVSGDAKTYSDGTLYDCVIASEVIEHLKEPAALLQNVKRSLKAGGLLILTCPNGYGPWEFKNFHLNPKARLKRWNVLRRWLKMPDFQEGDTMDHVQWFTMKRLLTLTARENFTLIRRANSDFLTGSALDVKIADRLPSWAVSGWYFAFRFDG